MKEKFTIILLHYNQEKYIKDALNSIFNQTYENIELIVIDDGSLNFSKEEIEEYIKSNSNIDYKIIVNKTNLGTVKTTNKALQNASGKYVLIFAADDILYNKNVINNFVKSFEKNQNIDIITSVCILYDDKMAKIMGKIPEKGKINSFNKMSCHKQNKSLMFGPVFTPGATAYRTKIFKEINYLDEDYQLIEDWSLFLKLSRLNYKIKIEDFCSIKHRGGGISENNKMAKDITDKILKDTDLIYKREVFPFLKQFTLKEKLKILNRYQIFSYIYGYKYWPIYLKYYSLIFSNFDILIKKLFNSYGIYSNIYLPILTIIFVWLIYSLFSKDYVLILGSIIIYLILLKILKRIYFTRRKTDEKK